jgi:hypothetical protein
VIACKPLGDEGRCGKWEGVRLWWTSLRQTPRAAMLEGHQRPSRYVRRHGGERAAATRQLQARPVVPRSPARCRSALLRIPIGSSSFRGGSRSVVRPVAERRPVGEGLSRARLAGARLDTVALVERPATARKDRGPLERGSPTHRTTSSVVVLANAAPKPGWPPVTVKVSRAQVSEEGHNSAAPSATQAVWVPSLSVRIRAPVRAERFKASPVGVLSAGVWKLP